MKPSAFKFDLNSTNAAVKILKKFLKNSIDFKIFQKSMLAKIDLTSYYFCMQPQS